MGRKNKSSRPDTPEKALQKALKYCRLSPLQRQVILETTRASAKDLYGDGDQSPIPDVSSPTMVQLRAEDPLAFKKKIAEAQHPFVEAWPTFLDVKPQIEKETSGFHLACLYGIVSRVKDEIRKAEHKACHGEPDAVKHLLEKRISLMRVTALHLACIGCLGVTHLESEKKASNLSARYEEVVKELYRAGARIDARDICGYTPLFYVAGAILSTETSCLVSLLISFGADVDAKSRFGTCMLTSLLEHENVDLLRNIVMASANIFATNYYGAKPFQNSKIIPIMWKAWGHLRREMALRTELCSLCRQSSARKYCSRCRETYYCSRKCQLKGWKNGHKAYCTKTGYWIDIDVDSMITKDERDLDTGIKRELRLSVSRSQDGECKKENYSERLQDFLKPTPGLLGVHFPVVIRKSTAEHDAEVKSIQILSSSGPLMQVDKRGAGSIPFEKLLEFINSKAEDMVMACVVARWVKYVRYYGAKEHGLRIILQVNLARSIPFASELLCNWRE